MRAGPKCPRRKRVLGWTQMVHRPFGLSTGPQSCCGIQVAPPRRKGMRAKPSESSAMPFSAERVECVPVEAVTRRNPDSRVESVRAQNPQALSDPFALGCGGHAGKLRSAGEALQGCGPRLAQYGGNRAGRPRPPTLPAHACVAKRRDQELSSPSSGSRLSGTTARIG